MALVFFNSNGMTNHSNVSMELKKPSRKYSKSCLAVTSTSMFAIIITYISFVYAIFRSLKSIHIYATFYSSSLL